MQRNSDSQKAVKGPAGIVFTSVAAPSVDGAPVLKRWEFMSMIVWDDDSKSLVNSDLEDVEVLNTLGSEGWELVCVVPLARTQVLEMAYPGNTRKLLAYLKRPLK
jgi:hypothetical protein